MRKSTKLLVAGLLFVLLLSFTSFVFATESNEYWLNKNCEVTTVELIDYYCGSDGIYYMVYKETLKCDDGTEYERYVTRTYSTCPIE